VVDFLLALIELFSLALTVEALRRILVKIVVFERGVTLSANVRGNLGSSTNDFWRQETRVPVLSRGVICVILRLAVLIQYRCVTHRQTDRHAMMAITRTELTPCR